MKMQGLSPSAKQKPALAEVSAVAQAGEHIAAIAIRHYGHIHITGLKAEAYSDTADNICV
jgi:ABC-type phosphonate transport system ATPase subunit